MRFLSTSLPGVTLLEPERHRDERGYFARTWCERELSENGLETRLAQCSVSFNQRRGTLRGLHYQAPPHAEVKLVRCIRGALLDVALDLRPDSAAFARYLGVELSAENGRALYIPAGFAHGFYTLADETEVEYFISTPYEPRAARGIRWDDPLFSVSWPGPVAVIAPRDRDYPSARPGQFEELRGLVKGHGP
jgi:dTDP-4-dehydrorhamnose 3,5-epimerase